MSRTELLQSRHRDRLLTNSAAEFLETQADVALGPELAQQPPEFVPELDRFVPPDEITKPDYYEESQTKLLQFRQTLEAFQRTLTDRRLGERYDVQVKETYTIQDVLAIAQTIQERHEGAEEVHSCMGKIRKFFRASGRNASTLQRFLEFVPNGDYTSVICGGFTVILGALERLETLRTDMYKALSDIPKIMSRIHRHLAVHFQSARLKHCADMVWVAVFTVLEAIIRELSTKSSKKAFKVLIKGDAHATDVTTSLASLTAAVNEFEAEANICDAQRLGQVDRATQETWSTTRRMESNVQQLSQGMSSFSERLEARMTEDQHALEAKQDKLLANTEQLLDSHKQLLDNRREESRAEQVQVNVYNVFYCFLTASPSFDSKTGTLQNLQAGNRLIRSTTPLSMDELRTTLSTTPLSRSPSHLSPFGFPHSPSSQYDSNKAVKSWLREAQRPERTAAQDLRSCLGDITAQADLDEQDRVAYILASDELRNWLRTTTSQVLVVELRHSPRDQHFTASSYASAVLARSLTRTASPIVLTHLCSSRETDPENGTFAGGKGVLVSLVGQLASQIVSPKHRSGTGVPVDLGFLVNDKSAKFSRISNSTSKLLAVFERMLDLLPPASGTVYVILDGIWRLSPESKETKRVIAGLLNLAARLYTSSQRGEKRTVLKMFITEPFSTDLHEFISDGDDHGRSRRGPRRSMSPPSSSKHPYIKELSVPEHIPGGNRAGVNVAWVNEEVDAMIHECTSSSSSAGSANGSGAESEGREVYGSRRRPGDPWRKGKKDSQLSVGSGNRTSRRGLRRDQGRRSNSFSSDSDGD